MAMRNMIGRRWTKVTASLGTAAMLATSTPGGAVMSWSELLSRPHPKATARIAYGKDPLQFVDLWLPKGRGPFPVVLMIHGGCWQSDVAQAGIMDYTAGALRDRGIAVWNIDYRGVDRPGGGYPGTFQDVAAASDALRTYAPRYKLSLTRLVAFGHSAGGHLALWAAARGNLPKASPLWQANPLRIPAVISSGGLPDLEGVRSLPDNCGGPALMDALTGLPHRNPATVYDDTSPVRMMPIPTRQILVAAALDPISPPGLTSDYARRAERAGSKVRIVIVPDEAHVELIAPGSSAWATETSLIEQLLLRKPK